MSSILKKNGAKARALKAERQAGVLEALVLELMSRLEVDQLELKAKSLATLQDEFSLRVHFGADGKMTVMALERGYPAMIEQP